MVVISLINLSILWVPLKIRMPKKFTSGNFGHPVSKSWLRPCHCNIQPTVSTEEHMGEPINRAQEFLYINYHLAPFFFQQ